MQSDILLVGDAETAAISTDHRLEEIVQSMGITIRFLVGGDGVERSRVSNREVPGIVGLWCLQCARVEEPFLARSIAIFAAILVKIKTVKRN